MIEAGRRHGHFDPRFDVTTALTEEFAPRPTGGSAQLEWYGFLAAFFAEHRRHDGKALKAYEAYLAAA